MSEGRTLAKPVIGYEFIAALVFGAMSGVTNALMLDRIGETWQVFCIPAPLFGVAVGLGVRHAMPLAVLAFYLGGLTTAGVLGHLNLLPCALFFFGLPTLLFGAAGFVSWSLLRLWWPRTPAPRA